MREKIDFNPDYGTRATNSIIKVIGIGGGGGHAVRHMYQEGIVGVDFLICNTDKMALEANPIPTKLVIGDTGLGAGANPEVAKKFAEADKEKIEEFIGTETKLLFITAGLGKGTGTGASPVIAKFAKEMGILTIAVVTIPFEFEGDKAFQNATAAVSALKEEVDSLILIKNENLFKCCDEDMEVDEAYGYVDDILKNAVKCIAELITVNLDQNIDYNDVKHIMQNSGVAMLAIAEANGENRVDEVFSSAFNCPLLSEDHITNAQNFLFSINYGPDKKLTIGELKKLTNKLNGIRSANARVIWGKSLDESLKDKIKLSVIVSNFDSNVTQERKEMIEELFEPYNNTIGESEVNNNIINSSSQTFKKEQNVRDNDIMSSISGNDKTNESTIHDSYTPQNYEDVKAPQRIKQFESINFSNDDYFTQIVETPEVSKQRRDELKSSRYTNECANLFNTDDDSGCFLGYQPD